MLPARFAGFCKFDNSLGNHFIGEIASLGKPKSCASDFKSDAHDPLGLGVEFGIVQKLSDGHDGDGRRHVYSGIALRTPQDSGESEEEALL